jgi:hypothetical protein
MTTTKLTDKQQQAIEHVERARSEGVRLSQYARAQGLDLRPLYDALAAARRKGVAAHVAPIRSSPFVAVRVTSRRSVVRPIPMAPVSSGMMCRVVMAGATVIECAEWPPPAWLTALALGCSDAAP